MKKPNKKKFEVGECETIEQCLQRMSEEGYAPVRRLEEPIFHETIRNGKVLVEPYGRKIIFEGTLQKE